jgi:hypothetical protein
LTNGAHIREEDLELYALGALPENEAAAITAHAAGCAECTMRLAEVRGRVALLALSVTQEQPAAAAKEKLMARIRLSEQSAGEAVLAVKPREADVRAEIAKRPERAERISSKPSKTSWWNWVLVPATLVLAGLCLMLWQQNKQLLGDLREARRVAADFERERLHVLGLVNVLSSPDTVTVKLASTTPADAAQVGGVVRYNQRLGSVVYSAELPTLPSGKIYQMWLVPKSGTPISAGTFADGRPGKNVLSAAVPPNTEPKAFAVTIEPAGGVPQPTGKMILLGAS